MSKKNGNKNDAGKIDLPVEFGGVTIGQQTAKLGLKISREVMNIIAADESFCGRRVTGSVGVGGQGDSPGQQYLLADMSDVIDATFDIHRFSVGPDHYTTGLTFKLKEIDIGQLARFSKGTGRLVMSNIELIPTDVVEEKTDDEDLEDRDLGLKADGPWRDVSLDQLFQGAILKSLKQAGLATVGDLHDYQQPEKNGFIKQLTDIKGIGSSKVEQIEERMLQFWKENPQEAA